MSTNADTHFFAYGAGISEFKCFLIHRGERLLTIDVQNNKVSVKGKEIPIKKFTRLIKGK